MTRVDGCSPIDLNWTLTRPNASEWQQGSDSQHLQHPIWQLEVGGSIIVPTKGARNLGVFFDSKLDMKSHIFNICPTCYFQLRQLRTVCRSLQPEILKTLLHAFVSCRLDYYNSLFAGLPACDIAQLQLIQNAAARLFGSVSKYDSVTPVLRNVLHWPPIKEQINFKIGVLTYKALNGLAPSYLSEMLVPVCSQSGSTSKKICWPWWLSGASGKEHQL